jgi:VanZ family protein
MTLVGHMLTGTAIGVVAMPEYQGTRQKTAFLLAFALLATVPDWPFRSWGHIKYYVSHSIFTNLLLIGLGWIIFYFLPRIWRKPSIKSENWELSWQLMLGGSLAWLSHLLLDTFYNHKKGLAMFWPFSDARIALPVPWLAVVSRPFLPVSAVNLRILLLDFLTFFPLVLVAIIIRKALIQKSGSNSMRQPIDLKWITVGFVLFIILIIVLDDAGRLPSVLAVFYSFRYGDKAGHFLLMGLMNFLVVLSFPFRRSANLAKSSLVISLVVGALVSLEEGSQVFFSTRTASLGDLASSYAGIILFGILAFWLRERRTRSDIKMIEEGRVGE